MVVIIGAPEITSTAGRVTYQVRVAGFPGSDHLWFSVPTEFAHFVHPRSDAAVVALLVPLMAAGAADVVVEGEVTDELIWFLNDEVQEVLTRIRPELNRTTVTGESCTSVLPGGTGVATAYSAGVDSYAVLARYHVSRSVPPSLRLTHLLYNNVGSHGPGDRGRELFEKRLGLMRSGARTIGLPLVDVDSNVDDFHTSTGMAFQPSHTLRNAAVAHLLSGGIGRFFYAASVPYEDVGAKPTFDSAFADPLLLPFVSTRSLTLQPAGTEMDRSGKTAVAAGLPHSYQHLDVCVESTDGTNCSRCWKCRRTMLTLDLAGQLALYSDVFETPTEPDWREKHLAEALTQDMPSARSIVRLYEKHSRIPRRLRAQARARVHARRVFHAVRARLPARARVHARHVVHAVRAVKRPSRRRSPGS